MLIVTSTCNLHCIYCYEKHKSLHYMPLSIAKESVLNEIQDSRYDRFIVDLMGGEPLLAFPMIKELCEWFWSQNYSQDVRFFASTNGTLLTDDMRSWFLANKCRIELGLSIDGNQLVQDMNRPHSFKDIDIDFFQGTWPDSNFKVTISSHSLPYLFDSIVYLEEKGVKHIKADLANMNGYTDEHLKIWNAQLCKLANYYAMPGMEMHSTLLDIPLTFLGISEKVQKKCGCGDDLVCINWDGRKYPCQMFAPLSMDEHVYKQVKGLDFADKSLFVMPECEQCILFPICPTCYGCNLNNNGDMTKMETFYCKAFLIRFFRSLDYRVQTLYRIDDGVLRSQQRHDIENLIKILTIH